MQLAYLTHIIDSKQNSGYLWTCVDYTSVSLQLVAKKVVLFKLYNEHHITNTSNHYCTEPILNILSIKPNFFVFSCVHQQSGVDHEPAYTRASPGRH